MKALKSIEDAAGLLAISKWTVRRYIRDGKLQPVRLGRRVLLEDSELERFIAESKKTQDKDRRDTSAPDSEVSNGQ